MKLTISQKYILETSSKGKWQMETILSFMRREE